MNTNRADLAALAALTSAGEVPRMFEGNPLEGPRPAMPKSRFNVKAKSAPSTKPHKLPPGVIEMFTPESDFMEKVQVREGSPEHIKLMRHAAQMEPNGPEAKELRRRGIK